MVPLMISDHLWLQSIQISPVMAGANLWQCVIFSWVLSNSVFLFLPVIWGF